MKINEQLLSYFVTPLTNLITAVSDHTLDLSKSELTHQIPLLLRNTFYVSELNSVFQSYSAVMIHWFSEFILSQGSVFNMEVDLLSALKIHVRVK